MDLLIQGIGMGLVLSIMVGPILFTLLQASLDRGPIGGTIVGSGIWISDFMYITLLFLGFSYIQNVIKMPDFSFYGGVVGAVILTAVGVGMILSNRVDRPIADPEYVKRKRTTVGLFLKGFMINTFNPFTVFFWAAIVSNGLGYEEFSFSKVGSFFFGLMGTVILFDLLKIFSASYVRRLLTDEVILKIRKVSGIALIVFAIALVLRVSEIV